MDRTQAEKRDAQDNKGKEDENQQKEDPVQMCDNCESSEAKLYCSLCPRASRHFCCSCCQGLHRGFKFRHHMPWPIYEQRDVMFYCQKCYTIFDPSATEGESPLLTCNKCAKMMCYDCDYLAHMNTPNHVRTVCDAKEPVGSEKEYVLAGHSVSIVDYSIGSFPAYVGIVFTTGVNLCLFMELVLGKSFFAGKSVAEVGCGVGALPSLCAALLGATRVVATDFIDVSLEHTDANFKQVRGLIESAQQACSDEGEAHNEEQPELPALSTAYCKWGEPLHPNLAGHGKFDVVLGSYLLYDMDCFAGLAQTLDWLCHDTSIVYMTSDEPTREGIFLEALAKHSFVSAEVQLPSIVREDERFLAKGKSFNGGEPRIIAITRDG
jgi:predicted nicotinamide N-methyase